MFSVNYCNCHRWNAALQLCKDTVSKQGVLVVGPREGEWLRAIIHEAVTFSAQPVWTGEEKI